jgi:hypothetical protein
LKWQQHQGWLQMTFLSFFCEKHFSFGCHWQW